jgi:hypothetical protein
VYSKHLAAICKQISSIDLLPVDSIAYAQALDIEHFRLACEASRATIISRLHDVTTVINTQLVNTASALENRILQTKNDLVAILPMKVRSYAMYKSKKAALKKQRATVLSFLIYLCYVAL